jgi:hypothetical protein
LAFTTEVTLKVDALPPSKISWWWLFIVFRKFRSRCGGYEASFIYL